MLNKILSKKIKSPLSLRGAKQRSNLSGFSLIELMVAIAILAMAIFGIFHAYSTGFMGMADARDRTVATNYAREAMEDVKNMDFELITQGNLSIPEIFDGKYNRVINVEDNVEESSNLKKVTTIVFWKNRNGKELNIETSMLINKIEFIAHDAERILLYAYPYNIIFPEAANIELIAVIKDAKGNTVTSWDKDIEFSIYSSSPSGLVFFKDEFGDAINTIMVNPNNGVARVNLYTPPIEDSPLGPEQEGLVTIQSRVPTAEELGTDVVEIRVTWGIVSIELTIPEITDLKKIVDTNTSTIISAQLKDAEGKDAKVEDVEISFGRIGEGTLIEPLTVKTDSNGTAQITFFSGNNPGTSSITASANNLLSDNITVYIAGAPDYLEVIASPDYIYDDEDSTIVVTLKDVNGLTVKNPNDEQISINLNVIPDLDGQGTCVDNPIDIYSGQSSASSTFKPIGVGKVIIQATDNVSLNGQTSLTIASSLIAKKIIVTAKPPGINAGGDTPSIITATIKSEDGTTTVRNYKQYIIFTIQNEVGSFSYDYPDMTIIELGPDDYNNGEAEVYLYANNLVDPGISNIIVTSTNTLGESIMGEISVIFYVEAASIVLTTENDVNTINCLGQVPSDQCTIIATVVDEIGSTVPYVGSIIFEILDGSDQARFIPNKILASKLVEEGVTTIELRGYCTPGPVVIQATSNYGDNIISSFPDNLEITVVDDGTRTITVDSDSINLSVNKKELEFDINLSGGNLKVYNIQINGAAQKLYDVEIDNIPVYSGSSDDGAVTDLLENIEISAILPDNTHHIHLIFSGRIDGKKIQITFNVLTDCNNVVTIPPIQL